MGHRKKIGKRIVSLVLSLFMAVSVTNVSGNVLVVHAADEKDIAFLGVGTDGVGKGIANPTAPTATTDNWTGSYVYYGTYDGTNPTKYRVLQRSTTIYNSNPTMLLDCNSILYNHRFDDNNSNVWTDSELKTSLNGEDFLNKENAFTGIEKNTIAASTVSSHALVKGNGDKEVADWTGDTFVNYVALNGEKIFVLDAEEASTNSYGYSTTNAGVNNRKKTGDNDTWLRSANVNSANIAGYVRSGGDLNSTEVRYGFVGVSPAFNINLSSVIFASVISGTAGQTNAEYKLTLKDSAMNISIGSAGVSKTGNKIIVPYNITNDTTNSISATQVSVVMTNGIWTDAGWSSNAEKKYYGKLNITGDVGTSGTGSFELPNDYVETWHIYIVAENVNDGSLTDYASAPVEITIPTQDEQTVTAPEAKTGLKYTGEAQTLITAATVTTGNTAVGSIKYSLDNTTWSTELPKATNAGDYEVYYKVEGNDDYYEYAPTTPISVSIGKAAGSISYQTAVVNKTYGDVAFTNTLTKTGDGTVSYSSNKTNVATVNSSSGQVTITGAGDATITATVVDGTNYTYSTKKVSYTLHVAKADIAPSPVVTMSDWTYGATASEPSVSGNAGNGTETYKYKVKDADDSTYTTTKPSEAGTYTVKAEIATTTNYNSASVTTDFKINKASGVVSYATTSVEKHYGDVAFTNDLTNTGNGAVTYASGNEDVATVNSGTGQVTIVGVGEAVITATVEDGSNYTYADADKTASYTLTVSKALAPSYSDLGDGQKPTGKTNLKYTGSPQDIVTAPSEPPTGYTVEYSDDNGTRWSTSIPKKTDKGEYTVKVRYVGDANHTDFDGDDITVNIAKKDALNPSDLTDGQKPTGKTGLKYTSEPQDLVTEPTELPTGYTKVQYSKDGGTTWTDEIPTGTETGDYTVKVKYIGDDNHTDFVGTDIPVTIAKKDAPELTDEQKPAGKTGLKYTGESQELVTAPTELPTGYTKVQYSKDGGTTWTDEIPEETETGDYTVKVKYIGDDNHADFEGDDIPITIGKKDAPDVSELTDGQKPTGKTGLKYKGEPQELVTAPTEALPTGYTKVQYSKDGGTTWTDEIPTGTEAGDYTVKVKYVGDDNHTDFEGDDIPVTIGKKDAPDVSELTDEQKPTGKPDVTFTGEPQAIAEAPSELPDGYTKVQYSIDDGETWTDEIPKITNAGDYTVKTKYIGDNNHTDFIGSDISATIDRMTLNADDVTISFSSDSYGYTGNEVKPVPTITIKSGDKVLDSSDFDIIYTNNTEVGTATITIVTKDGANYVFGTGDNAPKTTFVIRLGGKEINTDVRKDDKSPEVKAANLTDEFAESTLSDEEKALIDNAVDHGKSVDIDLYLDIKDISDTISTSDKEKIKAYATNTDNIAFFDISLFKEIIISGQSQGATSIHELTTPLKLTIGVPKSFPAVADGYTRTYKVLRLHDGSVTVLPTTLNADGTLSFETDKFSTYALAYTDTKKEEVTTEATTTEAPTTEVPTTEAPTTEAPTTEAPTTEAPTTEVPTTEAPTTEVPTTEAPTTEVPTTETPTTKVDTPTTEAPKTDTPKAPTTGDKINLGVIVMLMIDSVMAGLYLTLRRRLMK